MQSYRLPLILCALLLCAACASTPEATPERDAEAKRFEPVTRDSVIYIYRPDTPGKTEAIALYVNRRVLGSSLPGTFFRVIVLPGPTVIETFPADGGYIEVETQGNDVTFVEMRDYGGLDNNPMVHLRRMPPEAAKAAILECCSMLETWRPGQPRLLF
jgi:hypothetical protein